MFTMLPWSWLLIIIVATWKISLSTAEIRVVCYYTNWSVYRPGTAKFNPQNINPYLCTHLIYAFGGFTKENSFKPFDKYQDIEKGGYAKFTGLKTYNKNLKTMLAVGGWNEGSSRFSPMVANAERRKEFVKNSVKFLRLNHFDGLDLDWEYPSFRDGGKPRDKDNYATLVQELREEYDREAEKTGRPRLLLTMAVPAGIEYINKGYDVPKLMKYLDWMNILSYDYHSAFEPAVNHHSPLFSLEEESEYNYDSDLNINHTINHYLEAGAERNKLVLGIPTYGRSYTLFNPDATEIGDPADGPGEMGDATRENGYLAYYEICEKIKDDPDWIVEQPNPKAMGPYAFKEDQWVGYDDESIVRKKAEFVAARKLGGIMFWSIDNDDFRGACHGKPYPLIEAAKEALITASGSTIDNTISAPEKSTKSKTRSRTRTSSKKTSDDDEDAKPAQNSGGRQNANIAPTRKRGRPKPPNKEEEDTQISNKRRLRVQKKKEEVYDDEEDDEDEEEEIETPKQRRLRVQKENSSNRRKQESRRRPTTVASTPSSLLVTPKYTTPEPPTTPDPGGDFKCEDEGFFPHPRDCKKYFWCLSGPSETGIIAHQFNCPSGLYFNKAADSCDYTQNVLCNKKKAKTTSTKAASATATTKATTTTTTTEAAVPKIPFTTRRPAPRITAATSRTTFVSSTTPEYQEEYEYEDEDADADDIEDEDGPLDSEEDPRVIKELIALIKKAGGIEELEKQLNLQEGGSISLPLPGSTTPTAFSKTLYERVLSRAAAGRNTERPSLKTKNSRGPQYDGKEDSSAAKRARPQYTAIARQRPSTEKSETEELEVDNNKKADNQKSSRKTSQPEYITISRNRPSTTSEADIETSTSSRLYADDEDVVKQSVTVQAPEYVTLKRRRPTTQEPFPKYVTIRGRTSSISYEEEEKTAETATLTNPSTTPNDYKTSELSNNEYINTVEQHNITDTVEVSKGLEGLNFGTETILKTEDETTQLSINSQNSTENSLSKNEQPFSSSQRYRSSSVATVTDSSTTPAAKVSDPISRNLLRSRPFQKPTDSTDNSHINNSTNITDTTTKRGSNRFNLQATNTRFKAPRRRPSTDNKDTHDEDLTDIEDDISNETDSPSVHGKISFASKPKIGGDSKQVTAGQFRPRPFSSRKPSTTNDLSTSTEKSPASHLSYNVNKDYDNKEKSNPDNQPTRGRGSAKFDYNDPISSANSGQYYDDGSYHTPNDQANYDRKFRPDIAIEISDLSSLTSVDISKPIDASTESRRRGIPRQRVNTKPSVAAQEVVGIKDIPILNEESSEDSIRTSLKPLPLTRSLTAQDYGKGFKRTVKPFDETVSDKPSSTQAARIQKENPVFIRPSTSTFRITLNNNTATNTTDSESTVITLPKPKPRINFAASGRRRIDSNQENNAEIESQSNFESHLSDKTIVNGSNSEPANVNLVKPKLRNNLATLGRRRLDNNLKNNTEEHQGNSENTSTGNNSDLLKPRLRNTSTLLGRRRLDINNKENIEETKSDNQSSSETPVNRNNRKVIRRFRPTPAISTSSSTSIITTTTPTTTTHADSIGTTEFHENYINFEISSTEQLTDSTTATAELSSEEQNSTEDSDKNIPILSIIVTEDNDIKENITEGGSSDNDEDVYRTSEEEEENIKLSETSIREKSEIHINALNDNSDKHRRRVVKKIRNEGKDSQTKVNYLQEDDKDADYSRNPAAVTEYSPIVRTRKIIRKLQPTTISTTESTTASSAETTKGRTRKIIRRLRPTTTEPSTSYNISTTPNTLEESSVTKNSKASVYGAKRIRPSHRNINDEVESNSPKYGFRRRQKVNVKNETESIDTQQTIQNEDGETSQEQKPFIRRISPLRTNKVKFAVNKEKADEKLENDESAESQTDAKSFGGRRIKLASRNSSDSSEDTETKQKQKTLVRRIIPQRRQKIKIYGDKESSLESNAESEDVTGEHDNSTERIRQKFNVSRRNLTESKDSEDAEKVQNGETDKEIAFRKNATGINTDQNNKTENVTDTIHISTTVAKADDENTETQTDEEESTTLNVILEDETLSSTSSSTDVSTTGSTTEQAKQNLEDENEDKDRKTVETSTKFYRTRLNRIQKYSTTTQSATTARENRFNIFSRFNSRRRDSLKSEVEVTSEKFDDNADIASGTSNITSLETNNTTSLPLINATNAETNNATEFVFNNATEENNLIESSTETSDEAEITTVANDEEDTTFDLDDVTQQTTIDDDFTVTDSSITTTEDITEKSTTIRTTTPFYYRAKLSRPPFLLQRNRAVTESSQLATATKESSRSTGFSPRYNARRKDKYRSRYDKTTSTESIEKAIVEDIVNATDTKPIENSNVSVTDLPQNQTESSVNLTDTTSSTLSAVSTPTPELSTTQSESKVSTDELDSATTEIFTTTELDVEGESNITSKNQSVPLETSTVNASAALEVTTLNSTSSVNTEEVDSKLIQNITDSILDAELLALIEQYEADREVYDAIEKEELLNSTASSADNQTAYVNTSEFNNTTIYRPTVVEETINEDGIALGNSTNLKEALVSSNIDDLILNASTTTEDTLTATTSRRTFLPRKRITTTTQATSRKENQSVEHPHEAPIVMTTSQRPKYKPRARPTERTLLYKQTTRKITVGNEFDRSTPGKRFYIKPTSEHAKLEDDEELNSAVTENSEAADEEDYDEEEDDGEEYDDEEEQQEEQPLDNVNEKAETTEKTYSNSFYRPNKPFAPKRTSYRGSTEKPSSIAPRRFGGARNSPASKQANNPAPYGNTEAKSPRNKLFNKPRKVNTPYAGVSVSATSPSTVSTTTTTELTSISTQEVTNATLAYQQESTIETTTTTTGTTESRSTTEASDQIVTLHHIFSETESSTPITTEIYTDVTGRSADKKVERLIEVNRIVEVTLKEGKFKHNAMVESEVTLSPTLDRIGAINRVTVIKVVDSVNGTNTEIISNLGSLKDADKLRLNVTLPTDDVNKQKSLINDIINAISPDLKTHAINISIINDLAISNATNELGASNNVGSNLVSNGTKLEESNLITTNAAVSVVTKETPHKDDPNLIQIYSSGEVVDYGHQLEAILPPHTQEEEDLAKAQIRIDGKSVVNTFTPKPSFNTESSTIALEGLFQPDWNRLQRDQSSGDEILQTQNANYVNIKILDQDESSRRLKFNEEQPIVPIRVLKQDEYSTSRAQVVEITPEMNSGMIKIAPIAISVGNMHPVAQHRHSEHTEHTTVVFPVSISKGDE